MRVDYFWVSQRQSSARCGASKARLDLIYAILVLKRWLVLAAVHVGMSITTSKRVQFAAVRKWPLLMILTLFVGVGLSTPAKAQVPACEWHLLQEHGGPTLPGGSVEWPVGATIYVRLFPFNVTSISSSNPDVVEIFSFGTVGGNATTHRSGIATITAETSDPACATATLNITVKVTEPPTVGDTTTTVDANSSNNLVNLDIDGYEVQFVEVVSGPSNGSATISASGTGITYTPNVGFSGTDSFTYTATNAAGTSNTANATIDVKAANPTVSWAIDDGTVSAATTDGVALNSGDAVPTGSVVEFRVKPSGGKTYTEAPSGCGVEYIESGATGDLWRTAPVTANCAVTFPVHWVDIYPRQTEATLGRPYEVQFRTMRGYGPFTDWSWSVGDGIRPDGLSLDPDTGVLSGTPEKPGVFYFYISVTNSAGHTDAEFHRLTVHADNANLSALALSAGALSPSFDADTTQYKTSVPHETKSITVTPTADDPGATITVNNQTVASGSTSLAIALATGETEITVRVTAQDGNATKTYTIAVTREAPAITLGPDSLPAGSAGASYGPVHFTVEGGSKPYGFSVTEGELPEGLDLAEGGELSGTPVQGGTFTFTVTVTDANGFTGTRKYTLTVDAPEITVIVPGLPSGKINADYGPVRISASGGAEPYAFDLASGQLPEGMTLAGDGTLSGTPTEAGEFAFTVRATDRYSFEGVASTILTIDPLNLPVAQNHTLEVMAGTTGTLDLTQGATGGPFTGAAIAAHPESDAGAARIAHESGAHVLHFTAAGSFAGTASLTYTLSNADGVSAPATVTLTVIARPDPSRDPEVIGLIRAQTATARRFADTQITNFNRRLEQLHHEDERRSNSLGLNVSVRERAKARNDRPHDVRARDSRHDDARPPASAVHNSRDEIKPSSGTAFERASGDLAFWSGGFVNFGTNDDGAINLDHTLVGVSIGMDYRFSPELTAGLGLGYGRDVSEVGSNRTESRTNAFSVATYGSYRPAPGWFIGGLAGYGTLRFDSQRYVTATGDFAKGSRQGKQFFASLSTGYEYRNQGLLASPYARLEGSRSTLRSFTETGAGMWNLAYGEQTVNTVSGALGIRLGYDIPIRKGTITPRGRLEYIRDFSGSSRARLGYADLGTMPYAVDVASDSRHRLGLELGLDAQLGAGTAIGFDYRTAFGTNHDRRDHSFGLKLRVLF